MSDAPDDASRWSWVTPDGKTITGAKGELMLALRSERLPATTLVWRSGWADWITAARVTELKSVLPPGKAEPAQAPKLAPGVAPPKSHPPPAPVRAKSQPPPAPVRAKSAPPPAPVRAKSQAPPGPVRSAQELPRPQVVGPRVPTAAGPVATAAGAQAHPRGASILGPPREPMLGGPAGRAPLNTLGGEELSVRPQPQHTLRPPGAVPPPPRGGMAPAFGGPMSRADDELPTQRHLPPPSAVPSQGVPPTELRSAVVVPTSSEAASTQPGGPLDFDSTLGSTPFDSGRSREIPPPSTTLESAAPLPTVPPRPSGLARARGVVRPLVEAFIEKLPVPKSVAIGLAAFLAVVLLATTVAIVFGSRDKARSTTPDSSASAAAAPSAVPPGCTLVAPAARLATTIERAVLPSMAEAAPGERVAVGFASAPKVANGLIVQLDTLDVERPLDEPGEAVVRSSAPRVRDGAVKFSIDRANAELGGMRTQADGSVLGFSGADLVTSSAGQKSVLFAGAASDKTTDPRIAVSSAGSLVTFRRGGLAGQVVYGWVAPDGKPKGSLTVVNAPGIKMSGTPDAAANASGGVIAFAGRPSENADWRIQLADASGDAARPAKAFEPPPGGAGGGSIAPSVTALGKDGWLLQWTEGAAGSYQVRLQRFSAKLEPLGEARLVSPKGANSGQGAVFAAGQRVLSVFVQTTAGHDELWGSSLECH